MDTSQIYIEMCAKAEEIQAAWKPRAGDFYIYGKQWTEHGVEVLGSVYQYVFAPDFIWLPRQDQLQKMMGLPLWRLNFDYSKWLYDVDDNGFCDFHIKHDHLEFTSMEQLWLAFVMWELYKKRWGEIEWRGMQ